MSNPPEPATPLRSAPVPAEPLGGTAARAAGANEAGPLKRRGWSHVIAIVVLTLSVLYLASLTRTALLARRGDQLERNLATEVGALDAQVGRLATAAVYARSDAYVEQWARDERGLARPGDHVMVPVAATGTLSGTQAAGTPVPSTWDRLKQWLGGER